ncbi:hypothetical protein ACFLZ3_05750, partial [Candidatus Omnitrophota bacterium]
VVHEGYIDLRGPSTQKRISTPTLDRSGAKTEIREGWLDLGFGAVYDFDSLAAKINTALVDSSEADTIYDKKTVHHYREGDLQRAAAGYGFDQGASRDSSLSYDIVAINNGIRRELATRSEVFRHDSINGQWLEEVSAPESLRVLLENPLTGNPAENDSNYFVQVAVNHIDLHQDTLYTSTNIYDAQGNPVQDITQKRQRDNGAGLKTVYHLPDTTTLTWSTDTADPNIPETCTLALDLGSNGQAVDISGEEFLYFYVDESTATKKFDFLLSDGRKTVQVTNCQKDIEAGALSFWDAVERNAVHGSRYHNPSGISEVTISERARSKGNIQVISVAQLRDAGLNTSRITEARFVYRGETDPEIKLSQIGHLGMQAKPDQTRAYPLSSETQMDSRGVRATQLEIRDGDDIDSIVQIKLDERTRMVIHPRKGEGWNRYEINVVDNSNPKSPRPLYTMDLRDGRLLSYNIVKVNGTIEVYALVHGFDSPRVDIYDARYLEDELRPDILKYGPHYYIVVKSGRSDLLNRINSNSYNVLRRMLTERSVYNPYAEINAEAYAERVRVENSVAYRYLGNNLPWLESDPVEDSLSITEDDLKAAVQEIVGSRDTATGLPKTSFQSPAEPYMDLVEAAEITPALIENNRGSEVVDMLHFLHTKFSVNGHEQPLSRAYHRPTGLQLEHNADFRLPLHSRPNCEGQFATALAAFQKAAASDDQGAYDFGKELVLQAIEDFYPLDRSGEPYGGFSDAKFKQDIFLGAIELLSVEEIYLIRTQAKAYLVLNIASQLAESAEDREFKAEVDQIKARLVAFMQKYIMPRVKGEGVVPASVQEIYGINTRTVALAPGLWTSAESWLWFIEAAQAMDKSERDSLGINEELLITLVNNLVRAHWVEVNGDEGLDWSVEFGRPEGPAISGQATIHLLRVVNKLGYHRAAEYIERILAGYKLQNGMLPEVLGTQAATAGAKGMETGQGYRVLKSEGGKEWPYSPYLTIQAYNAREGKGPYDLTDAKISADNLPPLGHQRRIPTMVWIYLAILASFIFLPLINYVTGLFRRLIKSKIIKSKFHGIGITEEFIHRIKRDFILKEALGMKAEAGSDGRLFVIGSKGEDYTLDGFALNRLTAFVALVKFTLGDSADENLKQIIKTFYRLLAYELWEQRKQYVTEKGDKEPSFFSKLGRVVGVYSGAYGYYTHPRYQPHTLINDYILEELDRLRLLEGRDNVAFIEEFEQFAGRVRIIEGNLDELKGKGRADVRELLDRQIKAARRISSSPLNNKNRGGRAENYRTWVNGAMQEGVHPLVQILSRIALPLMLVLCGVIILSSEANHPFVYNFLKLKPFSWIINTDNLSALGSEGILSAIVSQLANFKHLAVSAIAVVLAIIATKIPKRVRGVGYWVRRMLRVAAPALMVFVFLSGFSALTLTTGGIFILDAFTALLIGDSIIATSLRYWLKPSAFGSLRTDLFYMLWKALFMAAGIVTGLSVWTWFDVRYIAYGII